MMDVLQLADATQKKSRLDGGKKVER